MKDGEVAGGVSGSGDDGDAGNDFGFAIDGLDLMAERSEAAAGHGLNAGLGIFGQAQAGQVGAGAGPELPFDFGEDVAGVGEGGAAEHVDGAADVVGVGVGEDDGIDIVGTDAGDFEARLNGSGGARVLAGAGIDEDDVAAGFDEQAGIGAEDGFRRLAAAFEGVLELGRGRRWERTRRPGRSSSHR